MKKLFPISPRYHAPSNSTFGAASYSVRTWQPAVLGFILTVRDGHPDAPLLVCSPVFANAREQETNRVGMSLPLMRETLETLVAALRGRGDANIHYLNGLDLLGPDDGDTKYEADGVHPNGDGYELIGRRFADLAFAPRGPFAA